MKHLTQVTSLFIVVCLAACTQSRLIMNYGEPVLIKGEPILIGEIKGASLGTSIDSYETLNDELKGEFGQVSFIPHYEYDLIASGLTKAQLDAIGISPSVSKHVAEVLKMTYFISMEILNYSDGDASATHIDDQASNVQIQFKIVDLNNLAVLSGFMIDISSTVYEGEHSTHELATSSGLLQNSMRKTAKRILKNAI